jgi:hypothetical protein
MGHCSHLLQNSSWWPDKHHWKVTTYIHVDLYVLHTRNCTFSTIDGSSRSNFFMPGSCVPVSPINKFLILRCSCYQSKALRITKGNASLIYSRRGLWRLGGLSGYLWHSYGVFKSFAHRRSVYGLEAFLPTESHHTSFYPEFQGDEDAEWEISVFTQGAISSIGAVDTHNSWLPPTESRPSRYKVQLYLVNIHPPAKHSKVFANSLVSRS